MRRSAAAPVLLDIKTSRVLPLSYEQLQPVPVACGIDDDRVGSV